MCGKLYEVDDDVKVLVIRYKIGDVLDVVEESCG
jgi:phenylacetate-coenzyme A ligase PaaK-like adenylate-forming protein